MKMSKYNFKQMLRGVGPGTPFAQCEALALLVEDCAPDEYVLEIGSFYGRTTCALMHAMQQGHMLSIDPYNAMSNHGVRADDECFTKFMHNTTKLKPIKMNVFHFRYSSTDSKAIHGVRNYIEKLNLKQRLVFVDGVHTGEYPCSDYLNYINPLTPVGGLVAFHDYTPKYPAVRMVVDDIVKQGWFEWVEHFDNCLAILRRLR